MYYLTESNGGREIAPLSPYLRQIANAISKEVIKDDARIKIGHTEWRFDL